MAKKELTAEDYKYVDAWYSDQNGRQIPWTRILRSDLIKFQQEEALNYNCFATVQAFANPEKVKGEAYTAPLYFDLDHAENPAVSQADAVKLIKFFTEDLDIREKDIWVYFSGSKGFHILINSQALGIHPRADLHKIFKHIAGYLIHRLELTSMDLVVYSDRRLLRLPNSVHQKTKLYKIELSLDEVRTLSLEEIKEKASTPRREPVFTKDSRLEGLKLRGKSGHFYHDKMQEYLQAAATNRKYDNEEFNFKKGSPPVCVQDILEGGWKKDGDRNQATVQLACYYKDAGHNREDTLKQLEEWVLKHTSAGSDYQKKQRLANTRSVVDAVFSKDNTYKFGCAFIRSLHGPKKPGEKDYERVACAGDMCPCVKKISDEDQAEPEVLHLSKTGDANLSGKLVKTNVMIAGKKHTPYIVPSKIEYHCWGRDSCKKYHCPLYDIPTNTGFKDLGVHDRELIQMTGVGDDNITGILKQLSGIPNCGKYNIERIENTNVDELLVIPMAEEDEEAEAGESNKYVLRRVYAVGGLPVNENKYYELTGYVYPHPKNQESTLLLKSAKPLQDVVESFRLTEDVKEQLAVFQPADYTGEAIEEKLAAICNDLTYNVTHIVERDETLMAMLLTYHSVLRFNVPWDSRPIRGWVETKVVGDTGTGKSAMIEKIMKFCGLGSRVNAESTSRTGLTYKMEQSGASGAWYIVWGAWPLADKELLWIDEDTGIEKDEYGEMTLARSDGKLEVKRAVTAETPCRVRAILSGNVPKGKRLADYAQGVESLKDIFNNEDIRRFDAAIFMRAADVDPALYNQKLPTFPSMISAETMKNNILYAWSRKPDDVIFTDDTIDLLLETSTELSRVYGNANDIPLVSPSDQRNKLARLATSLAALTHSVDESGERIVVHPGHVQFIGAYLKEIYNAPGCGLNYYAKLAIKEEEMTTEKFKKIERDLRRLDVIKKDGKYYEFIKLFAQQRYLRLGDVEAMLSIEKEDAKAIVNQLARMRMVTMTSGGYRKTPRFNSFVAKCFELGLFDMVDDEY
ncbi:DNA primase [Sutcliffiella horikoshii]|uniref:DNA primase n=1 Tax=Sutcliffiella horikoshii TaxID=79883 RepID=A0A5D4SCY5_9BACI|nr:DNA primase small subunit domain-containing protein [Sutcliffiella horikoshii]TYS60511.1 DNA primase [Sutcliffiella horikoshii]